MKRIPKDLNSLLHDQVNRVFGESGWLATHGYRYSQEQLRYAQHVVDWLAGVTDKPIGLLEAETGIGKTLGYLVPLMLYLAQTGRRGALSTFTIALQDQIIHGDMVIAERCLTDLKIIPVSWAQRIGRQHFVDADRVDLHLSVLQDEGIKLEPIHHAFKEWADEQLHITARGLFADWYAMHGELPHYIHETDVCLTNYSSDDCETAYSRHSDRAKHVQLIITSHTMLFENIKHKGSLLADPDEAPLLVLVCDEADQLPHAAEAFGHRRVQLKAIAGMATRAQEYTGSNSALKHLLAGVKEQAFAMHDTLQKLGDKYSDSVCVLLNDPNKKDAHRHVKSILGLAAALKAVSQKLRDKRVTIPNRKGTALCLELGAIGEWLAQYASSDDRFDGIAWSPVYRRPSISSIEFMAGRRLRAYLTGNMFPACRILLTSATMGYVGKNTDKDPFVDLRSELGISDREVGARAMISPAKFGSMKIVLADRQVSVPFIKPDGDDVTFSKEWLDYTGRLIQAAAEYGSCLVLVQSFQEAENLRKRLEKKLSVPLHVHSAGRNIRDCINGMKKSGGILISPSLWEGFSVRGKNGAQLFTQLILTRLPFKPPSEILKIVFVKHYMKQSGFRTEANAEAALYAKIALQTLRKFRQGIGRGIRQKSDSITLWVADPRFPFYEAITGERNRFSNFRKAIPMRFEKAYQNAQFFSKKKNMLEQPVRDDIHDEEIVL